MTNVCPGPVKTEVSKNALTSDGSTFGETDKLIENGMSVERYNNSTCMYRIMHTKFHCVCTNYSTMYFELNCSWAMGIGI